MRRWAVYLSISVLFGSVLWSGARAAMTEVSTAASYYLEGSQIMLPQVVRASGYIERKVVPGAPIFLIETVPDGWMYGLWQGALYPDPIIPVHPVDFTRPTYRNLCNERHVHYAISVGKPPIDPGFRWREPLPGLEDSAVFGELR